MDKKLFLTTPLAESLYQTAAGLPMVDYHNHLSAADIADDRVYEDIASLWLLSDPYKHRVMRICGVEERLITGAATNWEKFGAWCRIFPELVGNPLYDWSRMEMEWIFGIDLPICAENAEKIWAEANARLREPGFSAQGLLQRFDCRYTAPCTTLLEDLSPFARVSWMAPSLRGDDLLRPGPALVRALAAQSGREIRDLDSFRAALAARLDAFHEVGCRFADHALDNGFVWQTDDGRAGARFAALLAGAAVDEGALACDMLRLLAPLYAERGWIMQLHLGAQRRTSTRLRTLAGAAGGFACIGSPLSIASLTQMLDELESLGLPRTLLFAMNPADAATLSVLTGSFSEDGVSPKVGQGPAWWWCDHAAGMRNVLDALCSYSVLSVFIGVTTDSRSMLSLLRHDYFRRVLCGWLGEKAKAGELPEDPTVLASLVKKLCFENAANALKGVQI